MKKKIMAMVAFMLVMAMETITAIASDTTSSKTGDIDYSTILITLIAIVCIIVCSSKLSKK